MPFCTTLGYDLWSYSKQCNLLLMRWGSLTKFTVDVMRAILPQELYDEIPVGFNQAGHVGKMNSIS